MQSDEISAIDLPTSMVGCSGTGDTGPRPNSRKTMEIFSTHIRFFFNTGRLLHQMLRVFYPFLTFFSLACLPALLFSSCTKAQTTPPGASKDAENKYKPALESTIRISQDTQNFKTKKYDVLVYEDDAYGRLDSHQVFIGGGEGTIRISSGSGRKVAVVLGNMPDGFPEWAKVLSLRALSSVCSSLENEGEDAPVLSGAAHFTAGDDLSMVLHPLMARIRLKSLCCDFRSTAYAFEELKDIRVYLTNVRAECSVIKDGDTGVRLVNNGALNYNDMLRFQCPGIVYRELESSVGMDPVGVDLDFYCYPNPATVEGFGSPFTRLVIEGTIRGKRWYWPINLNTIGKDGIKSNESYNLSVMLRHSGTSDPDIPISLSEAELKTEIEQWNEKENYKIVF